MTRKPAWSASTTVSMPPNENNGANGASQSLSNANLRTFDRSHGCGACRNDTRATRIGLGDRESAGDSPGAGGEGRVGGPGVYAAQLVPLKEFCRANAGLKYAQIRQLARDGLFPLVRVGRKLFVHVGQFEAWVRSGGAAFAGGWRRHGSVIGDSARSA